MTTYWSATAGDDDPHAKVFTVVTEAEDAAKERSRRTYHHTAYVRRHGVTCIREYRDGVLVGYLDGNDHWVECHWS